MVIPKNEAEEPFGIGRGQVGARTAQPQTTIVTYVPGDKSEIKPGTKIFIAAAKKQPDGSLQTPRINYGKDGLTPPM